MQLRLVRSIVDHHVGEIPSTIAVRELFTEKRRRVQRLVDVAAEVQEPAQVHGLLLLGPVLDLLYRHPQLPYDVLFFAWRLMAGGVDHRTRRNEGEIDVMPGRTMVLLLVVVPDPV